MEPRIQYAKTSDGVNIAYCQIGDGRPLVFASNVWGDLQWSRKDQGARTTVQSLVSAGWQVVRYDARGMGASDRSDIDFSLDAKVRDLEAVVAKLQRRPFPLCGYGQGGPTAIEYTLTNTQNVSHLILVNSFAVGSDYYRSIPAMRALRGISGMAEEQWEFFTETLAAAVTGFDDSVLARSTAEFFRDSMSPEAFLAFVEEAAQIDLRARLPLINVPTLVVQDESGFITGDLSRFLASQIPNACFVVSEDYTADLHAFVLGEPMERIVSAAPIPRSSGTAVILFLDIADSTELTTRLGDASYREKERDLDGALRQAIRDAGGSPVEGKVLGDGVMATFASAKDAIDAALRCQSLGADADLPLHAGIHAGDVTREGNNVHGGAVQVAARIASDSSPGELLVSDIVRGLARTSAGVSFEDRGERELKGVSDPVRVFAVRALEE